ncbi:MAG TPA: hypothetical protein VEA36_01535 [Candidatus Paceibacterota bacterium]|nr:hypothetical protein [Candidatus Paceibacterota bacterium]
MMDDEFKEEEIPEGILSEEDAVEEEEDELGDGFHEVDAVEEEEEESL